MKNNQNNNAVWVIMLVVVLLFLFSEFGIGGFGSGGRFMGGFMILFTVALVLFIVWIIKQIQYDRGNNGRRN